MQDEKHTEHKIYVLSEGDLQEIQLLIEERINFFPISRNWRKAPI